MFFFPPFFSSLISIWVYFMRNKSSFLCLFVIFFNISGCAKNSCVEISDKFLGGNAIIQEQSSKDWVTASSKTADGYIFTIRKTSNRKVEKSKLRIQANVYNLSDEVEGLDVSYSFELDGGFVNLEKNAQSQWLTIMELWHRPGWKNFSSPLRTTVNLRKKSGEEYFRIHITTDYKEHEKWVNYLAIPTSEKIYPGKKNKLTLNYEKDEPDELKLVVNSETVVINIKEKFGNRSAGLWGLNPIKFYTSNQVLNRISDTDVNDEYRMIFTEPKICVREK